MNDIESVRAVGPGGTPWGDSRRGGAGREEASAELIVMRRGLRAAVVAIVACLLALVVVPVVVHERGDDAREDVERVLTPAEIAVGDLELGITREISLLRAYAIEGDSALLRSYREARADSERALAQIAMLLPQLPPYVAVAYTQTDARLDRWHDTTDSFRSIPAAGPDPGPDVVLARPLYERTREAALNLREDVVRTREATMFGAAAAERQGIRATALLAVLALVATALVFWLAARTWRLAEEARSAHTALIRASEARARLLRGFTHDLKNPLSASILHAQLLQGEIFGPLPASQRQAVGRIHSSLSQALRLVDDLLQLSRAEAGLLTIELGSVDLKPVVRDVVLDHVDAGGPTPEAQVAADLPLVRAEPRRVQQVLENLVGNAVKYTPQDGWVTVRALRPDTRPGGPAGGWVRVEVADSGPGIPPEMQERVFDEFVRLPGTAERTSGSGIGLTISRQMARAMGGEITLESRVGGGSTFILWLRVADGAEPHRSEADA